VNYCSIEKFSKSLKLKSGLLYLYLAFISLNALAASIIPENDDIKGAKLIPLASGYCSAEKEYTNADATASGYKKGNFWTGEGKDIWFKFTATGTDIIISVTGKVNGSNNTLIDPLAAIYTYQETVLIEQIGSMSTQANLTTAYKGGLVIGQEYFIRISAENNATGTFKLCINNYNPPRKPGQDCSSASVLCSKETFTELSVSGAGSNNREALGTCLGTESNSAWYTWTAANMGTLTFSITPTSVNDDIDWVLYDLGINGNCSNISAQNAIRCASGSGINCVPSYFVTGTNLASVDLKEQLGCFPGQDGFVKYIDMIQGHVYALLVDNFSNGNNGFTVSFDGTGEFTGPSAAIEVQKNFECQSDQSFTFSAKGTNYSALNWTFGSGADQPTSNSAGPHTITYKTAGVKTVVLEAVSNRGCSVIESYSFYVTLKPEQPIITSNKTSFCLNDVILLSVTEKENATYAWIGPDNFHSTASSVAIPVNSFKQAGDYSVRIIIGDCSSDAAVIQIPSIVNKPVASFITDPTLPGKFSIPAPIYFINQSKNAERFEWDFGDGSTSNEQNPTHTYTKSGNYTVSLNVFTANDCQDASSINNLIILDAATLLVPNSFSPNGDGINDEFNVNITNLKKFSISIFNRYGEKLFNASDIFNSWKGTSSGKPVPVGAYYYVITGLDLFNRAVKYSGSITLIR
jgi:gliding motility-associated-like protein